MKQLLGLVLAMVLTHAVTGCSSIKYVKSELTGTAKPEGGIQESIPVSRTYRASAQAVRRATFQVLEDQGYIYEDNSSTGTIRTEPKPLNTGNFSAGALYSAKLFVRLEGATVSYRAMFDKKSNITMAEQNLEFPEKEAELRKAFFTALDRKLSISGATGSSSVPSGTKAPTIVRAGAESSPQKIMIQQIQQRLSELGYQPGPVDGWLGKNTAEALKKFQYDNNLAETGQADNETIAKLLPSGLQK